MTRDGCYPQSVPITGPLTEEQARALLDTTPGVGICSPEGREREQELIRAGWGPDDEGKFLAWSWD